MRSDGNITAVLDPRGARGKRRRLAIGATTLTAMLLVVGGSAAADEFPETAADAIAYYEADVEGFMDGPVRYVALDEEVDLWNRLETAVDREAFIAWFWERRDEDLKENGNVFRDTFYERVAEVNDRFAAYPRGWRSDRGRAWIILGRPDGIRGSRNGVTYWTYHTFGRERAFGNPFGEIQVAFGEYRVGDVRILGGFGEPGIYPRYVLDAFRYTREAAVVTPDLELDLKA